MLLGATAVSGEALVRHASCERDNGMHEHDRQAPTVAARHRARLRERDDAVHFTALLAQARHLANRTYETTLYDHMQAFRLLWHHLESTGHLRRMHEQTQSRLDSGDLTAADASDLRLFLTVYATVRGD
jgi:hypothetical protein